MISRKDRSLSQNIFQLESIERRVLLTATGLVGQVINDTNDNGLVDSGEVGSGGWAVYVDLNKNGKRDGGETAVRTDSDGAYAFTGLTAGDYRVGITARAGWRLRATSKNVTVDVDGNGPAADFVNTQKVRILGTVFNDRDGDKAISDGEAQPGVRLFIDANSNHTLDSGERSVLSNSDGVYQFINLTAGTYRVEQVIPGGFIATAPTSKLRTVNASVGGSVTSGLSFGVVHPGSIAGRVFGDTDADGAQDSGEVGLNGARVFIDTNANGTYDAGTDTSDTTDSSGDYLINNLIPGTYKVYLVYPSGSDATGTTPAFFTVNVAAGEHEINKTFSTSVEVVSPGSIAGRVFNDADENGAQNGGETGESGVTVFIDVNNNGTYQSGTDLVDFTDSTGDYLISDLDPGTYKVYIIYPTSTHATGSTPAFYTVAVASGENEVNKNFSISVPPTTGSIAGFAWNDSNADGSFDGSETVISGMTVYLDTNNNGSQDSGEDSTTTASDGNYSFTGLSEATYHVRAIYPSGFVATASTPAVYDAVVTSGGLQSGNDFSLADSGSITGTLFEDFNINGIQDSGEPGISGQQIFIDTNSNFTADSGELTATTDSNGLYTFSNLAPGTYTVTSPFHNFSTPASRSAVVTAGATTSGQDIGLEGP